MVRSATVSRCLHSERSIDQSALECQPHKRQLFQSIVLFMTRDAAKVSLMSRNCNGLVRSSKLRYFLLAEVTCRNVRLVDRRWDACMLSTCCQTPSAKGFRGTRARTQSVKCYSCAAKGFGTIHAGRFQERVGFSDHFAVGAPFPRYRLGMVLTVSHMGTLGITPTGPRDVIMGPCRRCGPPVTLSPKLAAF